MTTASVVALSADGLTPWPSGLAVQAYLEERLILSGGGEVVEAPFVSDLLLYRPRLDPEVLEEGREASWDYGAFSAHGIFAELGEGFVDLPGAFDILKRAGYDGWLIVETDVTQKDSPLESALISFKYLSGLDL